MTRWRLALFTTASAMFALVVGVLIITVWWHVPAFAAEDDTRAAQVVKGDLPSVSDPSKPFIWQQQADCDADAIDNERGEMEAWPTARFEGADGLPYELRLFVQRSEGPCTVHNTQALVSAAVYRVFGDHARVGRVAQLFGVGSHGDAPEPHPRITWLGRSAEGAGREYLAVTYNYVPAHGDEDEYQTAIVLSVSRTPWRPSVVNYHGEIGYGVRGCSEDPLPQARVAEDCSFLDGPHTPLTPFGYVAALQFEASSTGGRSVLRAVASTGTDINGNRHRVRPTTKVFEQDADGIYQNADPSGPPASPVRICGPNNPFCFLGVVK